MAHLKLAPLLFLFLLNLRTARGAEPWDAPFAADASAILKRANQIPTADEDASVQILLEDHRISLEANGRARSTIRKVYRILKEDAVEDWASIEQAYQPWREQKPVIRARVITKAGSLHTLDPKTIADAPEQQFDASTFSDTRTVRAPLPAVEPGAVVEFEVATDSGPAFAEAGIIERLVVIDSVPIERFHVTIDAANGIPLQTVYRQIPDSAVRKTSSKGTTHIECELRPLKVRKEFELGLPPDTSTYPYFAFSTASSWKGLAARYAEIVDRQIQSAEVRALVASLPPGATPLELAGRLATELHRNIRYTGVEFGESAVIPARSDVATTNPIPTPPFWGSRIVERIDLQSVLPYINEKMLFGVQWGYTPAGRKKDEYEAFIKNEVRPILHKLAKRCADEKILQPQAVYGRVFNPLHTGLQGL